MIGADERDECSVRGCHGGVWFTEEQLCRHHGVKRGVEAAAIKKADAAQPEGETK